MNSITVSVAVNGTTDMGRPGGEAVPWLSSATPAPAHQPPPLHAVLLEQPQPPQSVAIMLVGDDTGCADQAWQCLTELPDGSGLRCRRVPQLKEAVALVHHVPVELILCELPPDGSGLDCIRCLRQTNGDLPIVVLTESDDAATNTRLRELGIDESLSRPHISAAALQRILGHAGERRLLKGQIDSSLRRERLRSEILSLIAGNAPLRDVLARLGHALRRELACKDCGFAVELDGDGGEVLLWPEDSGAAKLARQGLAQIRLHPGQSDYRPLGKAWVQAIRSGSRLLGAVALVPGAGAARGNPLSPYASLGADLAALAVDRLQTTECLRHSREELRHLSAQLMNIQETERQRIAGDLHDVIGQSLSVVKVSIEEASQQLVNEGRTETAAVLTRLMPWVKLALTEVRRISMDLRPATIDDLGILPTLSWFFREFGASCQSIAIEPKLTVAENDIPEHLKIVIFRILQEAFSNTVKHAHATRIQVVLQRVASSIHLAIIDNGTGFETTVHGKPAGQRSGLGLTSMRERASLSGGNYTLESGVGIGTSVLVTWPLPA